MILPSGPHTDSPQHRDNPIKALPPGYDPLYPFAVFRTSDLDTLRVAASKTFGASRVDILHASRFDARASFVTLPNIALAFGAGDCRSIIEHPETDYARLQIAMQGAATTTAQGQTVEVRDDQACITSAGHSSHMECAAGHERLTLRLNSIAMERKLAALLDGKPKGKLEFEPALRLDHPDAQTLLRMLLFLARELEWTDGKLPELILSELEQSIIVAVLTVNRHSFSAKLEALARDVAPWQVRRAEEYIMANGHRAILLEELVAVTNVSARSLFRTFKASRGYTPMAFAKLVRLKRARAILSEASPATTVAAAAYGCGFSNLGHFAGDYHRAFGELPSDTLAKKKLF